MRVCVLFFSPSGCASPIICTSGTFSLAGASTCTACQIGNYCVNGVQTACAAGSYASSTSSSICLACPAGSYCAQGSSTASQCSDGSFSLTSSSSCTVCPAGSFCKGGSKVLCQSGSYQSLTSQLSCIPCTAGNYCVEGSTSVTACASGTYSLASAGVCSDCPSGSSCNSGVATLCSAGNYQASTKQTSCLSCTVGSYCVQGSISPTVCPDGLTSLASSTSSTSCTSCPAGNFCKTGIKTACVAGTYQPSTGQSVCLACVAGSYCLLGASSPTACPDGKYSLASAQSSADCIQCPQGVSCSGGVVLNCSAGTYAAPGAASCSPCPAGFYCLAGTSTPIACPDGNYVYGNAKASSDCQPCIVGNFCKGGSQTPCAAGSYSSSTGAITCPACPAGSYCIVGSTVAILCPDGQYSSVSAAVCSTCVAGSYCKGGLMKQCSAGSYQPATGQSSCNSCPVGSYCLAGSITFTVCADALFSTGGSSTCNPCPAGSYCKGGVQNQCAAGSYQPSSSQTACLSCISGSYCVSGSINPTPCPDGFTSALSSQTASSCFSCTAGFYCKSGVQTTCAAGTFSSGGLSVCTSCTPGSFCLAGVSTPTACADGTYSAASASSQSNCFSCPAGKFCKGGIQSDCAAGTCQPTTGQSSCLPCTSGFYCPLGSINPTACASNLYSSPSAQSSSNCYSCPAGYYCKNGSQTACTLASQYCPSSSSAPTNVDSGYYSVSTGGVNTAQIQCSIGNYCSGGVRYLCPAGTYGIVAGLTTDKCTGLCNAGFFCVSGSTSATSQTCGFAAGGYSDSDVRAAKYYCPQGISSVQTATSNEYTLPEDSVYGKRTASGGICSIGFTCINGIKQPTISWKSGVCDSTSLEVDSITTGTNWGVVRSAGSRSLITAINDNNWSFYKKIQFIQGNPTDIITLSIDSSLSDGTNFAIFTATDPANGYGFKTIKALEYEKRFLNRQPTGAYIPYTIMIKAANQFGVSISCTYTIKTIGINVPPVLVPIWPIFNHIPQGTLAGTSFGTPLTATDDNFFTEFVWSVDTSVSANGNSYFSITCSGQMRVIQDIPSIGGPTSYDIYIKVQDNGVIPGPLYANNNCKVTIIIDRVNHLPVLPPISGLGSPSLNINERSPAGTIAGIINGADPDGDELVYSMISSTNKAFDIKSTTGEVYLTTEMGGRKLNYQINSFYQIYVQITDKGVPPLSTTSAYSFYINKVNEPPEWRDTIVRSINELSPANTIIGDPFKPWDEDPACNLQYIIKLVKDSNNKDVTSGINIIFIIIIYKT